MKFYMLVLALDTTTRRGSMALLRDGALVECEAGDETRAFGERLPGDLVRLLARHGLGVQDIDLYAVAAGPGSLTGLRIGIATMQGLALANGRSIVGVSTLDALKKGAEAQIGSDPLFLGAWLDAQRGEVFSALYREGTLVDGPSAEKPSAVLDRWSPLIAGGEIVFTGDGARTYAPAIEEIFPHASILKEVPPLASAIAELAMETAAHGGAVSPGAIRPIYVRRPDVELARERRAAECRPQ